MGQAQKTEAQEWHSNNHSSERRNEHTKIPLMSLTRSVQALERYLGYCIALHFSYEWNRGKAWKVADWRSQGRKVKVN